MIEYQKQTRAFLLCGKRYAYAMYVNEAGFLQNLHYGAKIETDDLEYLIKHFGQSRAPRLDDINRDLAFGEMPSEYAFYAHGDFREPSAICARADGAMMSRFRYVSHKIENGVPQVKGLPHARSGGQTLTVLLKDDFSDAEIALNYTVWDESDVLARNAEIKNTGKETCMLKKAFSFCLDLPEDDYSVLRLWGHWGRERTPEIAPLGHGSVRVQTLRGASSHEFNPFIALLRKDCSEDKGECYGVQLVYSGSFALTAEKTSFNTVRLQGGVQDTGFCWEVQGGERFITPQVALCYSGEGLGEMSREYSDFIREKIVCPERAYARRPILVNNWEATYFDFDNQKLCAIIDEAAELGLDTFVLDDGWFGVRNADNAGLGDWFVNEKKLGGGLKTVIGHCKKRGLKFGLWFEPEMVNEDSELYRAHPDWAIVKAGVEPVRSRNQLVLDFTKKEVVDYIYGAVSKVLAEHEISYVKWDMNRNITECYSNSLPAHRQGEFMHRYILGVYELAERLTSAFPNVFFEGCAGGGGRFDAGALYYFPQIWTSDDTDAYERTKIQWGTSMCYPLSSMSCHVSVCPNHQSGRTTPFETRGAVASLGATGYELDLTKMTNEEKEQTKKQIENYKRIDGLILNGDLYRLYSPFESDHFCEMVVSKDKTHAYVVGVRSLNQPRDFRNCLRLRGLDQNKTYFIEELNITASGKALVSSGVYIPSLPDFASFTWHIREAK